MRSSDSDDVGPGRTLPGPSAERPGLAKQAKPAQRDGIIECHDESYQAPQRPRVRKQAKPAQRDGIIEADAGSHQAGERPRLAKQAKPAQRDGITRTWLTIGQASGALGVDPDTLRRWSDAGQIAVFQTPGGHRRFRRETIRAMLPRPRRWRGAPLASLGEAPDRISAEFRRRVRSDVAEQDWRARLDEDSLRWFRERGVRMSGLLLGHLGKTSRPAGEHLAEAESLGREYGAQAARSQLSLGEATEAFLFFRARFMTEIASVARRRSLDAARAASLFEEADRGLDRVILALINGHQAARVRTRR
ncbi:MAG: helix-turn-helix domain-containing protein [Candidatus Limnocylindria bacterium]